MKQWFSTLQQREQRAVVLGAIVVTITLAYLFVWEPLTGGYAGAKADVARKTLLLTDARRSLAVAAPGTGARPSRTATQSLTLLVANSVNTAGLSQAYRSSSPTGSDELRVALENASFDALVGWLGQLQSVHSVIVTSASFTSRNEAGRVDASIVLQRLP